MQNRNYSKYYPSGSKSVIIRRCRNGQEQLLIVPNDAHKNVLIICKDSEESHMLSQLILKAYKVHQNYDFLYRDPFEVLDTDVVEEPKLVPIVDDEVPARGGLFGKSFHEGGGA